MLKKYDKFVEPYDQTRKKSKSWCFHRNLLPLQSFGILTEFPFEPLYQKVLYTD